MSNQTVSLQIVSLAIVLTYLQHLFLQTRQQLMLPQGLLEDVILRSLTLALVNLLNRLLNIVRLSVLV